MGMDLVPWLVCVSLFVCAATLVLTRLRVHALESLRDVLYGRGDVDLYLRLLDNRHLSLLFSRRALARMRLEGRAHAQGLKKRPDKKVVERG